MLAGNTSGNHGYKTEEKNDDSHGNHPGEHI